jgi:hypothetical protein
MTYVSDIFLNILIVLCYKQRLLDSLRPEITQISLRIKILKLNLKSSEMSGAETSKYCTLLTNKPPGTLCYRSLKIIEYCNAKATSHTSPEASRRLRLSKISPELRKVLRDDLQIFPYTTHRSFHQVISLSCFRRTDTRRNVILNL